jgi:hypothetical protein
MRTPEERIAVLETKIEEMEHKMDSMVSMQKEIRDKVVNGKGVVLGIAITVSAIWSTVLGIMNIINYFRV